MRLIQRAAVSEFRERIRWMTVVVTLGILALGGRIFYLQIIRGSHYSQKAEENILRRIYLPSTRGVIRDARGRVIAANRPSYNVYVVPRFFLRRLDETFPRFAEYLGLNRDERDRLEARIRQTEGPRRDQQMLVKADIDRETLAILETHRDELPGVSVIAVPVRTYPFGELAAHAIGYLNEVSAEDLEHHPGEDYRAGDRIGRTGIERAWESILRGRRGWVRVDRDHRGVILSTRDEIAQFGPDRRVEPLPGRDLVLTLDMELMRAIERAFRQRNYPTGAVVVVEVNTGRVLALYSRPSIDPNVMSTGLSQALSREIDENPYRPRIDKAIYEDYFPGSTFKPFTALAGMSAGLIDPRERLSCFGRFVLGNRVFRCAHGHVHGPVDLHDALMQSCNVYFYQQALTVTMDRIAQMAFDFGMGRRTGIGINQEAAGFIPTRAWYAQRFPGQFRQGNTLNTAIGQGNVRVSVLQLALAYAALANGGTLYVPQLIERVQAPDGTTLQAFPPAVRRRVNVAPQHLDMVARALRDVVAGPRGTARNSDIPEVEIAGKTGTAQVSRIARQGEDPRRAWFQSRDHAWFAAFAPASAPEIAVVTFVEHGGSGGAEAAPVAAQLIREYFMRIRPGQPVPSVRAILDAQEAAAARQRARNRPRN
jgi:penicillin-binding protein 2